MDSCIDKSYDNVLKNCTDLRWLPWVGKNYHSNKKKLLVVGESHYESSENSEEYERKFNEYSEDRTLSRYCIYESAINRDWINPTYDNLHRSLLRTNDFNKNLLWENICFYNFIQRIMDYRKKERPEYVDFYNSWKVFIENVKVLKPTDCIFIGVEASNSFNCAMDELHIEYTPVIWCNPISRTYPRVAEITINKHKTKIIFIQHSSKMFSWTKWNIFMTKHSPELFEHLRTITEISKTQKEKEKDIFFEELEECRNIPTWLYHKPVIASNYEKYTKNPENDAKFLSIGHAQYDYDAAAIKIFRKTSGNKWSRQGEELPINRVADFTLLLLSTINKIQNNDFSKTLLKEEVISNEDLSFLAGEIKNNNERIKTSLFEIKKLINKIDIDNI